MKYSDLMGILGDHEVCCTGTVSEAAGMVNWGLNRKLGSLLEDAFQNQDNSSLLALERHMPTYLS